MPKHTTLKDVLKNHPNLDTAAVERSLRMLIEMQKLGLYPHKGAPTTPVARRRARLIDDLASDPRAVRLRSK